MKNRSSFVTVLLILATKGSGLIKFAKLFKVAKPLVMFISMSISMLAYAFWMGPWLGILFTLLLLIHEMGHVVAMKMRGFATPTPIFIPFLGAAIFAPKFENRDDEAFVGYGGPLLGSAAAIALFMVYLAMPRESTTATVVLAASYVGVFLNLFNMIPISPLDGGRVTQAVGTWFRYIGMIVLAAVSIMLRSPVILFVWVLVVTDLTFIPIVLRTVLATTMGLAMAILMMLGYSDQPFWVDIIDCIFVALFIFLNVRRSLKLDPDEPEDMRPNLTKQQRWQWSVLYIGLFAILVVTIIAQMQYIPMHSSP